MNKFTSGIILTLVALITFGLGLTSLVPDLAAADKVVNIRDGLAYVETIHDGKPLRISRIQDNTHTILPEYAYTSRPCPPFCVQPIQLHPGVETIGELELLDYLAQIGKNDTGILVIDSREPHWIKKGMIPGSVNMPWTWFHPSTANTAEIAKVFELEFGAVPNNKIWDFSAVKTLVLYCNGAWCGQSPSSIRSLLAAGYPADRIKWYRGGMQSWLQFGLTIAKPE